MEKAKEIVSVNDGAPWIWPIIAMCYAPCIEIIDWWHTVEKLWGAANGQLGQGEPQTAAWVEKAKSLLWAGQLRALLRQTRQVGPRGQTIPGPVWAIVSYIFHNRRRMDYVRYHQAG